MLALGYLLVVLRGMNLKPFPDAISIVKCPLFGGKRCLFCYRSLSYFVAKLTSISFCESSTYLQRWKIGQPAHLGFLFVHTIAAKLGTSQHGPGVQEKEQTIVAPSHRSLDLEHFARALRPARQGSSPGKQELSVVSQYPVLWAPHLFAPTKQQQLPQPPRLSYTVLRLEWL